MKCGIDAGSRFVKIAFLKDGDYVVQSFDTIAFYKKYGIISGNRVSFSISDITGEENNEIVLTGYGKDIFAKTGYNKIPEIEAHHRGVFFQTGIKDCTIVDIGGQDTKVILVRNNKVVDFYMNEKCAAGSGRYIENMANFLGLDIEQMSLYKDSPIHLSSTCATIGESELITKVLEGYKIEVLAASVNNAVIEKISYPLNRMKSDVCVFVGGVAKNAAVRHFLELKVGKVIVPKYPQFNAAIGCAMEWR